MTDPSEPDLTAVELAFGLLDAEERDAAEARVARDPDFAAEVALWQERAVSLFDGDAPEPGPEVWRGIVARLPANDTAGAQLRRWRLAAGGAMAAALALGVIALQPAREPAARPAPTQAAGHPLVALLRAPDQNGSLAISIDPGGHGFTTAPASLDTGTNSAELWVIPEGGAPRSLGVVPANPQWHGVAAPLATQMVPGATLAVTVEPLGGSPTGKPTGPVILSAKIFRT